MADPEDQLDALHRDIIDVLREGRATPSYLSERTGESRQLISQRLRDLQLAGFVEKIHKGLYELDEDPREPAGDLPAGAVVEDPDEDLEAAPVDDTERERLIDEVPSSGELAERRADEVLKMYDLLRERGEAEKGDLLGVVDVEATGYASEASVWSNMVKGRDTLRALPGVETPREGMTTWRYTDDSA